MHHSGYPRTRISSDHQNQWHKYAQVHFKRFLLQEKILTLLAPNENCCIPHNPRNILHTHTYIYIWIIISYGFLILIVEGAHNDHTPIESCKTQRSWSMVKPSYCTTIPQEQTNINLGQEKNTALGQKKIT